MHALCQTYQRLKNPFGHTRWYHLVTRLKWKLVSILSDIVLILTRDRCIVCAKRSVGSEIIWMHPMVLLGDVGNVESRFGSFGDSVGVGVR